MATIATLALLPNYRVISPSLNLLYFLRSCIEVHKCILELESITQLVVEEIVRLVSITSRSNILSEGVSLKHFKISIGIF